MSENYLLAVILLGTEELIGDLGGDALAIAREAGIPPTAFANPNDQVDGNAIADFFELAAKRCDCPDFGVRFATRWTSVAVSHLSITISSADTVSDALRNFVAQFHLLGDAASYNAEIINDELLIRFQTKARGRWGVGQWVEAAFAFLCAVVRANAAPGWTPSSVRVRHAPAETDLIAQIFGPRLSTFQSEDTILIDQETLVLPLKTRGRPPSLEANLNMSAAAKRTPAEVKHQAEIILQTLLPHAEPTLGVVASALGISRRTLQRRLMQAGTNFNAVLDDARSKLAWRYVTQSPLRFHTIAEIIGFKEQTAFSHAFRRWYAMAPREARRAAQDRIADEV